MHALAKERGLGVQCSWANHDNRGNFDAVFTGAEAAQGLYRFPEPSSWPCGPTNDPANAILKQSIDLADLKDYLRSKLPSYMIPSQFEVIRQFPVTVNGKVDKRALLAMISGKDDLRVQVAHVDPSTDLERRILGVFEDVLGQGNISVDAR